MSPDSSPFTTEVPSLRPRVARLLETRFFSAIGSAFTAGGAILLRLFVIIALIPLYGWCSSVLWGWFMVPILHLPPITVWQAVAIAFVLRCFTFEYTLRESTKGEAATGREFWIKIAIAAALPFFFLLVGAILRVFIV